MRPIALLSDFGLGDHYVGVLHSVLERDAPGVTRIDISHEVARGDVWQASYLLRSAWPHLPPHAVVLAVVDPGVGTERRAVAAGVGGRVLVAPDNGLAGAVGPADEAVTLEWRRMGVLEPSRTFHGRDLFAPAAARIARGEALTALGPAMSPESLAPCLLPPPQRQGDRWKMTILHVDRFGNLITNLAEEDFPAASMRFAPDRVARRVSTYADGAEREMVLLVGSSGLLELAVSGGSAATATGLGRGDVVEVTAYVRGGDVD